MVEHSAQHVQGPESNPQHLKKNYVKYPNLGIWESGRNRKWLLMDPSFLSGWWKRSKTNCGSVCTTLWIYQKPLDFYTPNRWTAQYIIVFQYNVI